MVKPLTEGSIGILKILSHVHMHDLLAVGKGGEFAVNLGDGVHDRTTARKDGEEHDLRGGEALLEFGKDSLDAQYGVRGSFPATEVVSADHEEGDLGLNALDFSVLKTPEDILGAVATLPHVEHLALSEVVFIERCGLAVVGDRVANEDHINVALFRSSDSCFMIADPFFLLLGAGGGGDAGGLLGKCGRGKSREGEECGASGFLHDR